MHYPSLFRLTHKIFSTLCTKFLYGSGPHVYSENSLHEKKLANSALGCHLFKIHQKLYSLSSLDCGVVRDPFLAGLATKGNGQCRNKIIMEEKQKKNQNVDCNLH
jgi:hypothetical protein